MALKPQVKQALIIGASRGLGLGLMKEYLRRGWNVTATVRTAVSGAGLENYFDQLTMDTLDINNSHMVEAFLARMKGRVFDVIVLNAGIYGPREKKVSEATQEEVTHLILTNAIAPVRLAERLVPLLRPEMGVLAFMSSVLGSLEVNANDASPLYAASKAMLNRLTRAFAAEHEYLTIVNLHPGWVRTDMGGENATLDVETSARGMADVLGARAGQGGHEFLDYRGKIIPW
ncbi:SDR family oxidoreductase [Acidocella aminolytica]|jgi:NAD(P)-dependent dehydrogenase (short-subunit alcohol dehydrogenase family)|uniref:Short-chain dehydrogenase/reductase SDR n=1 Tax=Acidocella aminolytica 101 = DSM 11237 TaxID=1120923 RepID=A0A0D6PIH9_9PROT|nr:SDR family oxidoreductase [Acidocella aminolytica]GAN81023.1 short-chain dehydrogenase/reductase SDR [Acidocella aminolytica 101 = DSM 11237]GBQ38498.1 dehydrogenase [Acidocella aminolytica 101 = DSM 11237]SHE89048.1 NAD(P)-dependent dehydrogenase, short-chain alcohol dehydrogenase family [Acidocella aminolytica 101 = DSM 11237]